MFAHVQRFRSLGVPECSFIRAHKSRFEIPRCQLDEEAAVFRVILFNCRRWHNFRLFSAILDLIVGICFVATKAIILETDFLAR